MDQTMNWLKWQPGRQGTGYSKMLLLTGTFPVPFDIYLLKFPPKSFVGWHTDPVPVGEHHRLNVILKSAKKGGWFVCRGEIRQGWRWLRFRPDLIPHRVSEIEQGTRWVLSIGWLKYT